MRPTKLQVSKCLEALEAEHQSTVPTSAASAAVDEQFVIDLTETLAAQEAIRHDRVADARLLLDPRLSPPASDVADAVVRRLVCDRLR